MSGSWITDALGDLAQALVDAIPRPVQIAEGSAQGNVRASLPGRVEPEPILPGLVQCIDCGSHQRPGGVHFASNAATRPCVGSWKR